MNVSLNQILNGKDTSNSITKEQNTKKEELSWLIQDVLPQKFLRMKEEIRNIHELLTKPESKTEVILKSGEKETECGSLNISNCCIENLILTADVPVHEGGNLFILEFKPNTKYELLQLSNFVKSIDNIIHSFSETTNFFDHTSAIEFLEELKVKLNKSMSVLYAGELDDLHPLIEVDQNLFEKGIKDTQVVDIEISKDVLKIDVLELKTSLKSKISDFLGMFGNYSRSGNTIMYKNELYSVRSEIKAYARIDQITLALDVLSSSLVSCNKILCQLLSFV
ncbi:hypothetical protein BB558_000689 [Smittium angustum]|uniref:Uncharacterized protein n=1 Tax=Smittium angustum TaxID=133377 RepID=A0A2U1JDQ6_SMIAN|nr:hypothetical protein BB558_000689 [Smittium angustum]